MVDIVDRATRSRMMAAIGPANTAPELSVRRYLHGTGLRFRLHDGRLPGKPDIVLPRHRVAIFVHGCFWHRHSGCRLATTPASNPDFWEKKFCGNVERDAAKSALLERLGWTVLTIWECEARDPVRLDGLYWSIRAQSAELE
ncbi:very short patch repair endonuclease [Variovorax sp. Root411]|uniref:very short patch repair endonuclease n=1 Tax=Variovorax sp. Root411 TaxID=1736530 RepID=UPI0006FB77E8|nr:DNA mismatch endonuclease Vsr [Variovorax sp. Root411]KQW57069.1 hypothetical protein ASC92_12455 [Variovorax sp. Root411]